MANKRLSYEGTDKRCLPGYVALADIQLSMHRKGIRRASVGRNGLAETFSTKAMNANAFDFAGRACIVTGASRGLGRAIAMAFAKAGADIVGSVRNADACNSAMKNNIGDAWPCCDDAVSCGTMERPAGLARRLQPIDTLVNNASIAPIVDGSAAVGEDFSIRALR
jgi:hypothetical protein